MRACSTVVLRLSAVNGNMTSPFRRGLSSGMTSPTWRMATMAGSFLLRLKIERSEGSITLTWSRSVSPVRPETAVSRIMASYLPVDASATASGTV